MPFIVRDKYTNELVSVFGIRDDKTGFPQFLIYTGIEWKWLSAKHYYALPIENYIR